MKTRRMILLLLTMVALLAVTAAAAAWDGSRPVLRLERDVSADEIVAGELLHVTLTVHNDAADVVEYTLIEDVISGMHVQSTGKGGYNRAAGFIVWRGQLHAGAEASHTYTVAADAGAPASIPLFAAASTLAGPGAEHAAAVTRHDVVVGWEIKETHVTGSQAVPVTLHVTNPLPRPLTVALEIEAAAGLTVDEPWPGEITLAPLAAWQHDVPAVPATEGTHTMSVRPVVGGRPAGAARSAAISRFARLTENKSAASDRDDIVFLRPAAGHVYGEHEHMALSLEAPAGAQVTVFVNGETVGADRLAYSAVDPQRGRLVADYVAVPLQSGANEVAARALLADGSELAQTMTVHKAGAVSRLSVEPVTPLVAGQWRPLVLRVEAVDDNGLQAADGTPLTVRLAGGTIVSPDAHPGWQGHQIVVENGYALVEIAPPRQATAMTLHVAGGKAAVQKRLAVVAHADDWFVLGAGNVRLSDGGDGAMTVVPALRFIARGPLGSGAVVTAAMDSDGFDAYAGARDVWTGAAGETGSVGGDTGSLFIRWERDLSYVQLAHDSMPIQGRLLQYDTKHDGVQAVWHGSAWQVGGFIGRTAHDAFSETFAGDGTGFYPLSATGILPFSEDVVVQHRASAAPYEIVRVRRLPRTAYYIDYALGHIMLAQPLARTDEAGNTVHLHVTYRVGADTEYRTVGALQAVRSGGGGRWQATALQTMAEAGHVRQHAGLGGYMERDGIVVGAEAALSRGAEGNGFGVTAYGEADDVFGWRVQADARYVSPYYEPLTATDEPGTFARLHLEREAGPAASLFSQTTYAAPLADAPRLSASLGTRWLWGNVRPRLSLVAEKEGDGPVRPAAHTELAADYAGGRIVWQHKLPLSGGQASASLQGTHLLTPRLGVHVTLDTEGAAPGATPTRRFGWGLTQTMTGAVARTLIRGGVETTATGDAVQTATVVGAETVVALGGNHTVSAALDQRRPWGAELPGVGGALGWTYEYGLGESSLRYDHRVDGDAVKQAFAWRGVHALGDAWLLQGEALVTAAARDDTTLRVKLNGVYRSDAFIALLSATGEKQPFTAPGTTWEYRVQTAYEPAAGWLLNAGGARRQTAAGTVTDKIALGTVFRLSDRYAVQAQLTQLRQHDTATGLVGTMAGVSRQLLPDVWLTVGYGSKQYVGLAGTGGGFAQSGGGPFVELSFTFDEATVLSLFSGSPRQL